jgi:hypothetical protein
MLASASEDLFIDIANVETGKNTIFLVFSELLVLE